MAVSGPDRSAEPAWMNIAASMLAHAQTTRGVGSGPHRREVMMPPVDIAGVQGTALAPVIGPRP
jgi:flagellar basal body rod protein FlgC